MGDHREEEKVGLFWCKQKDNACGSYATSHHAFVSWLVVTIWFQLVICALTLLTALLSGNFFNTLFDIVFNTIWCLIWGYTGWWSFAFANKCWMVVFAVCCGLYAANMVRGVGNAFGLMDDSILFLVVGMCNVVQTISVVHTAVFAIFSLMTTAAAPGHLSFRWKTDTTTPEDAVPPKNDVEAPAPATMAP